MSSRKDVERLLELTDSYKRTVNSVLLLLVTGCSCRPRAENRGASRRASLAIGFLLGAAVAGSTADHAQLMELLAAPPGR
jgi:hypothetical protein